MKDQPLEDFDGIYKELERQGLRPVIKPLSETVVYHGTNAGVAQEILKNGFIPSNARLGEAIYVWIDSSYKGYLVAHAWAEYRTYSKVFRDYGPAVVEATVCCKRFFDPNSEENLPYFRAFFRLVQQFYGQRGDIRMHSFLEHEAILRLYLDVPEIRSAQVIATSFRFKPLTDGDLPRILEHPGFVIFDKSAIANPRIRTIESPKIL